MLMLKKKIREKKSQADTSPCTFSQLRVSTHSCVRIYLHRLTACVLCLAVAQTNQELHQGGLHGEDRPKGNASVCSICRSKLFLLLL